jgi:hypothetical protein
MLATFVVGWDEGWFHEIPGARATGFTTGSLSITRREARDQDRLARDLHCVP